MFVPSPVLGLVRLLLLSAVVCILPDDALLDDVSFAVCVLPDGVLSDDVSVFPVAVSVFPVAVSGTFFFTVVYSSKM